MFKLFTLRLTPPSFPPADNLPIFWTTSKLPRRRHVETRSRRMNSSKPLTISRREKGEGRPEKTAGNSLGGEGLIVDAIAMQCIHATTIPSMAWHASCLVKIDDSSHHVTIYPIGVINPSLARQRHHDLSPTHQANASWCFIQAFLTIRWQILENKGSKRHLHDFFGPPKGSMLAYQPACYMWSHAYTTKIKATPRSPLLNPWTCLRGY